MKSGKDQKSRITAGQVLCLCLVVVGVIGLGGEILLNHLHNMTAVYIFAAMGIAGFWATRRWRCTGCILS